MSDVTPVPAMIVQSVDDWITEQHANAGKWDDVELLDESQAYSLHRLAREVYASGFHDGYVVSQAQGRESFARRKDAPARSSVKAGFRGGEGK